MLQALLRILEERRNYWPMSVRAVHYALLNAPPLRNVNRSGSRYTNTRECYQDLSNLLTRARLAGLVSWEAISDETRPQSVWNVHTTPRSFLRQQMDAFLERIPAHVQQSQPNHIECIVEKNTVFPILNPVAMEYCLPVMSGRGFSSIDPYANITPATRIAVSNSSFY